MSIIILVGAVLLQTVASYGQGHSDGVGSYSYSDSSGKSAGYPYMPPTPFLPSTPFIPRRPQPTFNMPSPYGLNRHYGAYSPYDDYDYRGGYQTGYNQYDPSFGANQYYGSPSFAPNHFQKAFKTSIESQKLAFDAARKAFDVTSNQPGFNNRNHGNTAFHDFEGSNVNRYPGFAGFDDAFRGASSAFASGSVGPVYRHQAAGINPENPSNPNIKVTRLNDPSNKGYKSVSVTSFSSSSDINGQKSNTRKASTVINDNGKISRYDVSN